MKNTKEISRNELEKILSDYGHIMSVKIPVKDNLTDDIILKSVLNNGMPYNPFAGSHPKQMGISNNAENARTAMRFIEKECGVYSSYFSHVTGYYKVVD